MSSLINPYFYDPKLSKDQHVPAIVQQLALHIPLPIKPLQYFDAETTIYGYPKVFLVEEKGEAYKVRILPNTREAEQLYARAMFAYSNNLPTCRPLRYQANMVFFEYIKGSHVEEFSHSDIEQIAQIHAKMVHIDLPNATKGICSLGVQVLIDRSLTLLKPYIQRRYIKQLERILKNRPPIIIVFDHQDFGKHNLIKAINGKLILIDEEAFGAIPFGYSLIRVFYERQQYKIASEETLSLYLDAFPPYLIEYFIRNQKFFRALFIARNAARRFLVGNHSSAQRLIEEIIQL